MYSIDGITPVTFTLLGLVNAWLFGLFGVTTSFLKRDRAFDIILFPAVWALIEYLHHHQGFLSLTWGTLAYTQHEVPAVNWIASWAGIYGVSFLIVFVNVCVAQYLSPPIIQSQRMEKQGYWRHSFGVRALLVPIAVMILVLMVGFFRPDSTSSQQFGDGVKVALIQGGRSGYGIESFSKKREVLIRLRELTLHAAGEKPRLIVWPETAVPGRIPYDSVFVKLLSEISSETGSYLLTGASGYDKFRPAERQSSGFANSAFLLAPGEGLVGRYDKMELVPFNEYVPLRGSVTWPQWIVGFDRKDAQPGSEMTIMEMDDLKFGVQICWENLFPDHFRKVAALDVDFMVSITNESFVKAPAAREQMLAFNVYRAIENNVSIVRTASTGISAIISPGGDISERLLDSNGMDNYGEGVLVGQVQVARNRSFYNRHGDWFVVALALLMCVYFCILIGEILFRTKSK